MSGRTHAIVFVSAPTFLCVIARLDRAIWKDLAAHSAASASRPTFLIPICVTQPVEESGVARGRGRLTISAPAARLLGMRSLLSVPMMLLLATPAVAQDFEKGVEALKRGDVAAAMSEWRPLAEQGHVEAQFELGLMYDIGWGVPQDE